jgi:apolipoprotein N-acyltransferase
LLVQTDIPSLRKNNEMPGEPPLAQAGRLTQAGAARGTYDLIVWPETTVSVWIGADGRAERAASHGGPMLAIDALCRETHASILFGANRWTGPDQVTNAAMLVTPTGIESSNAKQRLVPFGERASYSEYLPFLSRLAPDPPVTPARQVHPMAIPILSVAAGERTVPARLEIGSIICFESCFRYPARTLSQSGARALFVLTNDEWFAGTNSPWEHAAMATVRAVENGIPVVQAANAGYSFAVDRYGRFVVSGAEPAAGSHPGLSRYGVAQAVAVNVPLP